MNRKHIIILLTAGLFVSLLAWSGNSAKDKSARQKARYYYSAAIREQALGNDAQAYEYYKKSYNADPSYAEASMVFGNFRLYIDSDELQTDEELEHSLSLMRPYVDQYPDDIYEAQHYGYVAGQLGLTDEAVRVLERSFALHPESTDILLGLSDVYARAYDIPNAVDAIDRYERSEGMSAQLTTRKIQYLLASNDTARVLSEITKLVNSNPDDASYMILKGNVLDILEMPDSAFAYYKKAEQIDPESGMAKLALADYYQEIGDSVNYDNKIYEVLLSEDLYLDQKADLVAQYLQERLRSNNDPTRGDHLFSVLKSQYPHEPRVLDLAARYSAAKGDLKDAVEQISYALDLDPTNATYWSQLLMYQASSDTPKDALQSFERARQHIEPEPALKLYYANVAQMTKEYDKALDTYKEMIHDIDPALATDSLLTINDVRRDISLEQLDLLSLLFTYLGDVYNMMGDMDRSYLSYDNAIVMDSSNAMAKNNYAYFLSINGGDLDKALQMSQEAISGEDSTNPTYIDTYAWISYLKGDYENAEAYQEKAVELMKESTYNSPEIFDHYGDILAKRGKLAEALEAWREAVKIQEETKETDTPSYEETLKKIKETEPLVKDLPKTQEKSTEEESDQ